MTKTIAAVAAGLLLVAGQAVAENTTIRVGDRVGAEAGESSYQNKYITKANEANNGFRFVLVASAAVGVFAFVVLDKSESD